MLLNMAMHFPYKAINLIIEIVRKILYRPIKKERVNRLLIYRIGSLGDNITAMPSICNIIEYYTNAKVDLLCSGGGNNVLSMDNLIDDRYFNNVINYDVFNKRELVKILRENRYDLVIELPNSLASISRCFRNMIFFRFILKIKSGFGWQVSTIKIFRRLQDRYVSFDNEIDRLNKVLKKYKVDIEKKKFILKESGSEKKLYEGINIDSNSVAIVVGSKRPQNRWPVEYFQEIVDYLISKKHKIYILGGKEDLSISREIHENEFVFDLCGQLSPIESAAILKKCKLTITNDTGPMHLSYAVGTRVLSIFSARDFQNKWYPPKDGQNVVFRDNSIDCRICLSDSCTNNKCMKNITPKNVIDVLKGIL